MCESPKAEETRVNFCDSVRVLAGGNVSDSGEAVFPLLWGLGNLDTIPNNVLLLIWSVLCHTCHWPGTVEGKCFTNASSTPRIHCWCTPFPGRKIKLQRSSTLSKVTQWVMVTVSLTGTACISLWCPFSSFVPSVPILCGRGVDFGRSLLSEVEI